jgi:methionine-rich copper-binding protein CopC
MAAMKQLSTSALAADGRTLVITPQGPLDPGRYTVNWHVVSRDTHKIAGSYVFAVK